VVEVNNGSEPNMGRSDLKAGQITIAKNMPRDIKNATLIHEVIHFILDDLGLHGNLKESFVASLSTALFSVMMENKKILLEMLNTDLTK